MGGDLDGKLAARVGLCDRIDGLERDLPKASMRTICTRVDEMRSMAAANRLLPVATIAASLSAMLAIEDRRALIRPYLDVMREAVGCERSDAATGEAFLASVGVRLAH